jgi:hypothetical protein
MLKKGLWIAKSTNVIFKYATFEGANIQVFSVIFKSKKFFLNLNFIKAI